MVYHIRIRGHLSDHWGRWFAGFTVTLDDHGDTLLSGPVVDQATLHSLLKKVCDLGIPLISMSRVDAGHADASDETYQYRSKKENKNE